MTDSNTLCKICKNILETGCKCLKCNDCEEQVHMRCTKIKNKQYEYFTKNPTEFECRLCCTCTICNKYVAKNHQGIVCHCCKKWIHAKCNKLNDKDYRAYQTDKKLNFQCMKCLSDTLPGMGLNNKEFILMMNGVDIPEEIDVNEIFLSERQIEIISKINKAIDNGFGEDNPNDGEDDIPTIQCKYYTTEEFNDEMFNSIKHFSVLHLNIHSVEFHIEELRIMLKLLNLNFDFICLTETKIKTNCNPKSDIKIEGYKEPVGMPTEAEKGGVLIYAQENINFIPREDLNIQKSKELESYFIEAINTNGKNIIIGVIYRHPCMNPS